MTNELTALKFPPSSNYYIEHFTVYSRHSSIQIYTFESYYCPCIVVVFHLIY